MIPGAHTSKTCVAATFPRAAKKPQSRKQAALPPNSPQHGNDGVSYVCKIDCTAALLFECAYVRLQSGEDGVGLQHNNTQH
jgi:hypothetical protein